MKSILTAAFLFGTLHCFASDAGSIRFAVVSKEATASTVEMVYDHLGKHYPLYIQSPPIISEKDIETVEPSTESTSSVKITLTEQGQKKFNEAIKDMMRKQIAIIVGDKIIAAPSLMATSFGREFTIDGNLTEDEVMAIISNFNKAKS